MLDVLIIGAGVTGSAIARELSRYNLNICVVEKEEDVCAGTSKANSGIVHSGIDAEPGTLKARFNVEGSRMMEELSKELDFPYRRNGSLVLCFHEEELKRLLWLKEKGEKNGVEGVRIIGREELKEMEPAISSEAVAALYAPSGGIVCPFKLTIALAENACVNGVDFRLNTRVLKVSREDDYYWIDTDRGPLTARIVINAAGVYGDVFHNQVSRYPVKIIPRRGEYCLLDRQAGAIVDKTVFQMPGKYGKGILVTPTVHGNMLAGPTAADIPDPEGTATSAEGLAEVMKKAVKSVPSLPFRQTITSFAGLRAHSDRDDFIIEEAEDSKGFIDVIGIESPGLTSAPAIGVYVADMAAGMLKARRKEVFTAHRKDVIDVDNLSMEERKKLIADRPEFGNIICRCEMVSEGEILDAIHRPLGARSLDGVKRRTRAGMGRCQSGFCMPRTMEILARELGMKPEEITKAGGSSVLLTGRNKGFE